MINDTLFSIVAYRPNKDRIISLLDNDELSSVDFSLFFAEDQRYQSRYTYTTASRTNWYESVDKIRPGLLRNLQIRSPGLQLDKSMQYSWMEPRELKRGDLSVLSKHYRAFLRFLESNKRFLVVFEDDIILYSGWLSYLDFIFKNVHFDYLDLAGGDGIITNSPTLVSNNYSLFRDSFSATRTACAYVVGRNLASYIIEHLYNPVFPIDWAISVALQEFPNPHVYWSCDNYFEHGSCTGKFISWRNS